MVSSYLNDIGPLPRPDPEIASDIKDLFSLKGKVASVTGSSVGIGFSVAEAYAQLGADVAIWYNSHPADDKAKALADKYGVRCKAYKCPLDNAELIEKTVLQQVEDFGTIDIFVANAGIPWTSGPILEAENSDENWRKVMVLDLDAVYYCARAAGKIFKQHNKGSFIITASMSGHIVNVPQLQVPYNAAKAALLHMSRSLAVEWAGFARVNTVSPGYIKTEISTFVPDEQKQKWWSLIPMGREAMPKELVGAYAYLASDASSYTTGSDIRVDGGYCCP